MDAYSDRSHNWSLPFAVTQNRLSTYRSERWKKSILTHSLKGMLDRVNVLGSDSSGHTGCVNALSWAAGGELLLSGGDDTTVRIWRMDCSDTTTQYPFVCRSLIKTGHQANIFNAQMLPYSSQIVTVAGDRQVRVFDIGDAVGHSQNEKEYSTDETCTRVLRCHSDRCKRIITEDSPDLFLTVAEDGCVRQHDLRSPHRCGAECPAPLVKLDHDLSTLALSPLTPYHIVVGGESPYGYLFDRRHAGRFLNEEWGRVPGPSEDDIATCVRRFGRSPSASGGRRRSEHITGARMSANNGHEVLLSFSSDAVYLYSTRDDPKTDQPSKPTSLLAPNVKPRKVAVSGEITTSDVVPTPAPDIDNDNEDDEDDNNKDMTSLEDVDEQDDDQGHDGSSGEEGYHSKVPIVLPRRRFSGACNVETVKDVNFIGPNEEYVASGSDDGNFFLWRKDTAAVSGVYEGDSSVVNVIEGHPHLPVIAVSGIDTTIKLFAPIHGSNTSLFSRTGDLDSIVQRNAEAAQRSMARRVDIGHLFLHYHLALRAVRSELHGEVEGSEPQCTYQ